MMWEKLNATMLVSIVAVVGGQQLGWVLGEETRLTERVS